MAWFDPKSTKVAFIADDCSQTTAKSASMGLALWLVRHHEGGEVPSGSDPEFVSVCSENIRGLYGHLYCLQPEGEQDVEAASKQMLEWLFRHGNIDRLWFDGEEMKKEI